MKVADSFSRTLRETARAIGRGKSFFLAGHLNPDGDTLGCSLALASVLRRMGKYVYIYSSDPVPENLWFMPGIRSIRVRKLPKRDFDVMILLECSTPGRAGDLKNLETRAKCLINIDHHRTAETYGDINLLDPLSSSNAELIYQVFTSMKVRITALEATCLYVGIVTDTGRFQYPATRPHTLETAARLLEAGARASHVNDRIYSTKMLLKNLLFWTLFRAMMKCLKRLLLYNCRMNFHINLSIVFYQKVSRLILLQHLKRISQNLN